MTEECARPLPALVGLLVEFRDTTHLVAFVANQFRTTSFTIARDVVVSARCLCMLAATALDLRVGCGAGARKDGARARTRVWRRRAAGPG
jgi:hypothetical protein